MARLSLTDLVDVVSASGTPKATKVRQIKNHPAYHPGIDYYKYLRDQLCDCHRAGRARKDLAPILTSLPDPRKRDNYSAVLSGYPHVQPNSPDVFSCRVLAASFGHRSTKDAADTRPSSRGSILFRPPP